jgi:hypothetical protein
MTRNPLRQSATLTARTIPIASRAAVLNLLRHSCAQVIALSGGRSVEGV